MFLKLLIHQQHTGTLMFFKEKLTSLSSSDRFSYFADFCKRANTKSVLESCPVPRQTTNVQWLANALGSLPNVKLARCFSMALPQTGEALTKVQAFAS